MRGILTLFTLAGSLLFALGAKAQGITSVTLAWNPSTSTNIAGYDIYYGTSSGNYISAVPVAANATNVTIRGLASGTTYYFAATSFDNSGNVSTYSPEVSAMAGATLPTAATMTSLINSQGQFGFTVSGNAGSQYIVQASTDLVNWVTLQTNLSPFNFVDSNASHFSRRFYRTACVSSN
jgi:hypothetical protein